MFRETDKDCQLDFHISHHGCDCNPLTRPQHPSECCDDGFLFNRTRFNKCIKLYDMAEFQEFEGLLENPCISECYYNESGMHGSEIDLKLAVNLFESNPYLSQQDVEKCVNHGMLMRFPFLFVLISFSLSS